MPVDVPPNRPQSPEPLPHPVVDNHAHLDAVRGGEQAWDVAEALAAAAEVNVTRVVQIGCELPSARWTVAAVDRYPQLLGGVALHPTEAADIVAARGNFGLMQALAEIEELARHPRIRVIGETGLDYHWVAAEDVVGRAAQVESFRWHIDLAKRTGKVLQIHDRLAHRDILQILAEEGAPERTVFHCFSGDAAMARHCVDAGWYLSFAGPVTFTNAPDLRAAARAVGSQGIDQLLVETDAPFLTPHPHRGATNASYLLPHTVRALAQELQIDELHLCEALWANSQRLYEDC